MTKKKTLGSILRNARLAKGLTLQTVYDAVGVSGSAIAHWEAGTNGLRLLISSDLQGAEVADPGDI